MWGVLGLAGLFELLGLVATQVARVRAHSPWQDDPYTAVLDLALTAVPVLGALLLVRLCRRSDGPRRPPGDDLQLLRGALLLALVVTTSLGWQAAAVGLRAHRTAWDAGTSALIVAVAVLLGSGAVLTVGLLRGGAMRRRHGPWRDDWLADVAAALARVPGVPGRTLDRCVATIRRHAVPVLLAASALGAVAVVTALAVGEAWTDPWLVLWALLVETASNFVLCMLVNALLGVVARPPARHLRLEATTVAAGVAVQIAVAFHVQLGTAVTGHPPADVGTMTGLTLLAAGAGAAVGYGFSMIRAVTAGRTGRSTRGSR